MKDKQHFFTEYSQPCNVFEDKRSSLPRSWHARRKNGFKGSAYLSILVEERSHWLLPLLGYGILVFALFDYIQVIIPPRFTNPVWEFQTIGALVEHAAPALIGLMFVFYRNEGQIKELEKNLLGFLSWISLLVGLIYLLMLPLGVADTWRIYYGINAQINAQLSQQSQHVQQIEDQLNQAKTDEQIEKLVIAPNPKGGLLKIKNPQELKDKFLAQISQTEQDIKTQAESTRSNQQQSLIKNSVKWHLGALVAGTLFILIWHSTEWARSL